MIDPNRKQNVDREWQLEAMLESLLRSYSAAEARPGFETRLRAVVAEQATRARRPNWWMLAASAAALVLFAWITITNPHRVKTRADGPRVAHIASPTGSGATVVIHVTAPARDRRTLETGANSHRSKANQIVLQMVASTEGSRSLVFEHEKLYLTPEAPAEREPQTETAVAPAPAQTQTEDTQAPAVSIKSIGVASIESNAPVEIKDLAPPKGSTEKGSL